MRVLLPLLLAASAASAEMIVPTRPLPALTVLTAADVAMVSGDMPDAPTRIEDVIGSEARVALYPGQPILDRHLAVPATIMRNDPVILEFARGGLMISTEGRSLGRGGPGDTIRVMNLASRATMTGVIGPDGTVAVAP